MSGNRVTFQEILGARKGGRPVSPDPACSGPRIGEFHRAMGLTDPLDIYAYQLGAVWGPSLDLGDC